MTRSKNHICTELSNGVRCQAAYSNKSDLQGHIASHHRRGDDPLTRTRCGKSITDPANRRRHFKKCRACGGGNVVTICPYPTCGHFVETNRRDNVNKNHVLGCQHAVYHPRVEARAILLTDREAQALLSAVSSAARQAAARAIAHGMAVESGKLDERQALTASTPVAPLPSQPIPRQPSPLSQTLAGATNAQTLLSCFSPKPFNPDGLDLNSTPLEGVVTASPPSPVIRDGDVCMTTLRQGACMGCGEYCTGLAGQTQPICPCNCCKCEGDCPMSFFIW